MHWLSHRRRTSGWHNCTTPGPWGFYLGHIKRFIYNTIPPRRHDMGPPAAAARCLQRAHTIRTHPGGVGSTERVVCPWWPWPLTLTFEFGRDFCAVHLTPTFHHPMLNPTEVILFRNRQTNRRHWKHPPRSTMLCRWVINVPKNSLLDTVLRSSKYVWMRGYIEVVILLGAVLSVVPRKQHSSQCPILSCFGDCVGFS